MRVQRLHRDGRLRQGRVFLQAPERDELRALLDEKIREALELPNAGVVDAAAEADGRRRHAELRGLGAHGRDTWVKAHPNAMKTAVNKADKKK
jgi:hypothetical protein